MLVLNPSPVKSGVCGAYTVPEAFSKTGSPFISFVPASRGNPEPQTRDTPM